MKIEVVIGANYGDEGKGLVTDWLCRRSEKPVVIMTNGGCQRGHTVETRSASHVFHHFGSGTLYGAPTYFPATYYMNPMKYVEEYTGLERIGVKPKCFYSEKCLMQFPADVYANRMLEASRGRDRHGSVGWGIWETVLRNRYWPVTVEEFARLDRAGKAKLCHDVFQRVCKGRLSGVKFTEQMAMRAGLMKMWLDCDQAVEHFIDDFEFMRRTMTILPMDDLFFGGEYETAIFENAQGLLLDCGYSDDKTHSTPSKTGLNGVVDCIFLSCSKNFNALQYADEFNANYVSRTYITRHGAGPFEEELPGMKFGDLTNSYNDWQGAMRFGELKGESVDELASRCGMDFSGNAPVASRRSTRLILTHMNERSPDHKLLGMAYAVSDGRTADSVRIK